MTELPRQLLVQLARVITPARLVRALWLVFFAGAGYLAGYELAFVLSRLID